MTFTFLLFNNITKGPGPYNTFSYTIEILLMLLIAALLGYLFRHFLNNRKYAELSNTILKQKQHILNIEGELKNINSKYSDLEGEMALNLSSTHSKEDEISTLKSKIRNLEIDLNNKDNHSEDWSKSKLSYEQKIEMLKKQLDESKELVRDLKEKKVSSNSVLATKSIKKTSSTSKAKSTSKKATKTKAHPFSKLKDSDLKIIEGIGPKIEGILHDAGINNWKKMSQTSVERIQEILNQAGPRYKLAVPKTWPNQAKLAAEKKWVELQEYQDFLEGGKDFT